MKKSDQFYYQQKKLNQKYLLALKSAKSLSKKPNQRFFI